MNIFSSDDYRHIIKERLAIKKRLDKTIGYRTMAEYIRIQKPYLSRVLNGYADFNSDQLFLACDYLEMEAEEIEYMYLLLEYERSTCQKRQEILANKIGELQYIHGDASKRAADANTFTPDNFSTSDFVDFYLDPMNTIVHVFLSIPKFRKKPELIREGLQIEEGRFAKILLVMERLNIIEVKNEKINLKISQMQLPRDSNITTPYLKLMSQLCNDKKGDIPFGKKKAFSVTLATDEKTKKLIEEEFNVFLENVKKIHAKGKAENAYQLTFDLFPWI
jgi:uncharacterized protein (TIGR02147 family)